MSTSRKQDPWEAFKAKTSPVAKIREIKAALPDGPGLRAMYEEAGTKGTVLGIPVLTVGRNLFLPRARVVEKIEGRD